MQRIVHQQKVNFAFQKRFQPRYQRLMTINHNIDLKPQCSLKPVNY